MRKFAIVTTVVLLAVCMTGMSAYAGAQKASFGSTGWFPASYINKVVAGAEGKLIINQPKGKVGMVMQGMVRGLAPKIAYDVYIWADGSTGWYTGSAGTWLGTWVHLASLTTSQAGNGNFHINIDTGDLGMGTYNISVWIDVADGSNDTVLISDPKISVTIP